MRQLWTLMMLIILAIVVLLACVVPARADTQVFGVPIEITGTTHKAAIVWYIDVRGRGRAEVADVAGCGAPPIGPAYAQYVESAGGIIHRTLYTNDCAYEILP